MAKRASLECELCEKACTTRLPHPTKKVSRGVFGGNAVTALLICLRCVDKVRRELGAAPPQEAGQARRVTRALPRLRLCEAAQGGA